MTSNPEANEIEQPQPAILPDAMWTERLSLKALFNRLEWQIKPYTFTDPYEFAKRDRRAVLETIGEMQLALIEINELVLSIENNAEENARDRRRDGQ